MTEKEIDKLSKEIEAFMAETLKNPRYQGLTFKVDRITPYNMAVYCTLKGAGAYPYRCYDMMSFIMRHFKEVRNVSMNGNIGNRNLIVEESFVKKVAETW